MDIDAALLYYLNKLDQIPGAHLYIDLLGNDAMIRGAPVFFSFLCLWFWKASQDAHAKLLAGLLASFVAVFVSVALQFLITPHIRPFMAAGLGITSQIPDMHLNRQSSFPSDTASIYFAISMVVFLEHRAAGVICMAWSLLTVGFCRVALGYHYPSDILGGAVLGSALVVMSSQIRAIPTAIQVTIRSVKAPDYVVNAVMFLVMADAYNQFFGILGVLHTMRMTAHFIMGHPGT